MGSAAVAATMVTEWSEGDRLALEKLEEECQGRGIFLIIKNRPNKRGVLYFEDFNMVIVSPIVSEVDIHNFIVGRFYENVQAFIHK